MYRADHSGLAPVILADHPTLNSVEQSCKHHMFP